MRLLYKLGWAYLGLCALALSIRLVKPSLTPTTPQPPTTQFSTATTSPDVSTPSAWFNQIRPRCNPVEVTVAMRSSPPPNTADGVAYAAACYSLAGKISEAREQLQQLPPSAQWQAAGIVFEITHPVADAGDDESAGPIMELVLEFQPTNYMALYHAGMSQYILGNRALSKQRLEEFMNIYTNNDGWRRNAQTVLDRIARGE